MYFSLDQPKKLCTILVTVLIAQSPAIAQNMRGFWTRDFNPLTIEPESCQFHLDKKISTCSKFVVTKVGTTLNYHFDIDETTGVTLAFLVREVQQSSSEVLARARFLSLRNSKGINTYPGIGKCITTTESVSCSFTGPKDSPMQAKARFKPVIGFPLETTSPSITQSTNVKRSNFSEVAYLNGIWEGSYTCLQGLTKLKLLVDARSKTDIDAVFMFSAHPQNPGVPSGRFRMAGTLQTFNSLDMSDLLNLRGVSWINQPSGWIMVDLKGDVSPSRRQIIGNIPQPGCSTFELEKREL